nr:MAG TPA_asm: hypothetical protein [Bacteriophage sp.]
MVFTSATYIINAPLCLPTTNILSPRASSPSGKSLSPSKS